MVRAIATGGWSERGFWLTTPVAIALVVNGAGLGAQDKPTSSLAPKAAAIHRILADRVDRDRQGVGIVAGVYEATGPRTVVYGRLQQGGPPVSPTTTFEVGSITKVFTALLLADMVQRGEVALDDPVARYLPPDVRVPERGRAITMEDLATHRSSLPADPPNLHPKDPANPLADYTVADLSAFLSGYVLPTDVGTRYEYSNVGVALLGLALAQRAGHSYADLIHDRIAVPLGLSRTRVGIGPEPSLEFAPGHSYLLEPVPNWTMPAFEASGGLISSADDLLAFLSAMLRYRQTPLAGAMALMTRTRRPANDPSRETALGWDVLILEPGYEFLFKDGATGGYRSFLAFDESSRTGVVVLSNAATRAGVVDIGMHVLNPEIPLDPLKGRIPAPKPTAAPGPAVLARYGGAYTLGPGDTLTVTVEGNRIFEQRSGQLKVELFAEDARRFYCRLFDEQVEFVVAASGIPSSLVFTENGERHRAVRAK